MGGPRSRGVIGPARILGQRQACALGGTEEAARLRPARHLLDLGHGDADGLGLLEHRADLRGLRSAFGVDAGESMRTTNSRSGLACLACCANRAASASPSAPCGIARRRMAG